ncbi:MAG: type VI secretion system tip protein VgrG [Alphaproteobacteria bacterium]|nr:type VI secretion system tip protein VgrG [Alphaproteobacteria bacterium]
MVVSLLEKEANFDVTFTCPLGPNKLIVDKVHAIERMSTLFEFTVDVHSKEKAIDFKALVGKSGAVKLSYKGGSDRYFSGTIGEVRQGITDDETGFTHYTLKIYPKFWMTRFNQDYRIFQNKSANDINKAMLGEYGVSDLAYKAGAKGSIARKYCVQYGESAFHYVTRLMAEEGVFYYFTYAASGDTLEVNDNVSALTPITPASVPFVAKRVGSFNSSAVVSTPHSPSAPTPAMPTTPTPSTSSFTTNVSHSLWGNEIQEFYLEERVVSKKSAYADYNFVSPDTKLYPKTSGDGEGGEVYRYPGRFFKMGTGEGLNNVQIEQLEWNKKMFYGRSTVPGMIAGKKFTLTNHPRDDANAEYILYEVEHFLDFTQETKCTYYNRFSCFPSSVPFRPDPVPKPRIYSNQTAIVVGPPGEEIHTDEHGRIKVQFYWDQYGSNNEKSSCWIRVAQLWSGGQWGFVFIPRIKMEVVVSFLEGDPDRPLVVGCVYNGNNKPPYSLPAEKTKSTIKTNSTKNATDMFNEIRFEDKKSSEQLYVRAQKDYDREVMKGERTLIIHEKSDTKTIVKGNYLLTHKAEGSAPPTHRLHMIKGDDIIDLDKGDRKITLTKGDHTRTLTKGNLTETLTKGDHTTLLDDGNMTETLTKGDHTRTLTKGNLTETLTKGDHTTVLAAGNMTITVTGNITINATANITLNAGGVLTLKGNPAIIGSPTVIS